MDSLPCTVGDIARLRLEEYLKSKLPDPCDIIAWEFYTFLLVQAKSHEIDSSEYCSLASQADRAEAARNLAYLSRRRRAVKNCVE